MMPQRAVIEEEGFQPGGKMLATGGVSRSGRIRKKSAKLIEMEDWDTTELEGHARSRKKPSKLDAYGELDSYIEKKVSPLKIPKAVNIMPSTPKVSLMSSPKKKKQISPITKLKLDSINLNAAVKRIQWEGKGAELSSKSHLSNPMVSHPISSAISSSSSESSPSSSDDSDSEPIYYPDPVKKIIPTESTIVQKVEKYSDVEGQHSLSGTEESSELVISVDESEGEIQSSSLLISEEECMSKKKKFVKKTSKESKPRPKKPQKVIQMGIFGELDPSPSSNRKMKKKCVKGEHKSKLKKEKDKTKSRPMTAYMLWCQENRKRIVAQNPDLDFCSISKKMGEAWKGLPDKEKMTWRKKSKKAANKGSTIISTGKISSQSQSKLLSKASLVSSSIKNDDGARISLQDSYKVVGTSPIDVAAHLKLLGESLSIIGQRLTEHEGQIAVSGSLSVLLDSTLCALGPLLCLTNQSEELNGCSHETLSKVLDNIAYIMPGL